MERWFQAAAANDISFIRENINRFVGTQDELFNQKTALHIAAQNGHLEIIKLLYEQEKMILSSSGMTALHYAAQAGQQEAVKLLLPLKDVKTNKGKTALELAENKGYNEIVGILQGGKSESSQQSLQVNAELLKLNDNLRLQNLELYEKIQALEKDNKIYKGIINAMGQDYRNQRDEDIVEAVNYETEGRITFLERQLVDMRQEVQVVKECMQRLLFRFDQYFLQ